jgi:hypothetical protein
MLSDERLLYWFAPHELPFSRPVNDFALIKQMGKILISGTLAVKYLPKFFEEFLRTAEKQEKLRQ